MKKCIGAISVLLAAFLVAAPELAKSAAKNALFFCGETLIPSLFPFFVCANLLIGSGLVESAGRRLEKPCRCIFGVGGAGTAAILLGFISGYPGGAAVTCRLYANAQISKTEAHRLLSFTNNAGPLFVIGVIGMGVYGNAGAGYILLLAQILAALSVGILAGFLGKREAPCQKRTIQKFGDPVGDAVKTVLTLCGFVVFFSVLSAMAENFGVLGFVRDILVFLGVGDRTAALIPAGLLEITAAANCHGGALPAMAALLNFGGCSVLLQTASLVRRAGLSVKSYIGGKALSAGLAALYCRVLLLVFPIPLSAAVSFSSQTFFGKFSFMAVTISALVYSLYAALGKERR